MAEMFDMLEQDLEQLRAMLQQVKQPRAETPVSGHQQTPRVSGETSRAGHWDATTSSRWAVPEWPPLSNAKTPLLAGRSKERSPMRFPRDPSSPEGNRTGRGPASPWDSSGPPRSPPRMWPMQEEAPRVRSTPDERDLPHFGCAGRSSPDDWMEFQGAQNAC